MGLEARDTRQDTTDTRDTRKSDDCGDERPQAHATSLGLGRQVQSREAAADASSSPHVSRRFQRERDQLTPTQQGRKYRYLVATVESQQADMQLFDSRQGHRRRFLRLQLRQHYSNNLSNQSNSDQTALTSAATSLTTRYHRRGELGSGPGGEPLHTFVPYHSTATAKHEDCTRTFVFSITSTKQGGIGRSKGIRSSPDIIPSTSIYRLRHSFYILLIGSPTINYTVTSPNPSCATLQRSSTRHLQTQTVQAVLKRPPNCQVSRIDMTRIFLFLPCGNIKPIATTTDSPHQYDCHPTINHHTRTKEFLCNERSNRHIFRIID